MKRKKQKLSFIGENKVNKLKRNQIKLKAMVMMILDKNKIKKSLEQQFKTALNYLNNHKFWDNKTHGIVQNVKILFLLKNKCKYIKLLRYQFYV